MSGDLTHIYQDVVVDHASNPRHFGEPARYDIAGEARNRRCGDSVTVFLDTDGERVTAVNFSGDGCAIHLASSSLMTTFAEGKSIVGLADAAARFVGYMNGTAAEISDETPFDILACVREIPARSRCATLAWEALSEALAKARPADVGGNDEAVEAGLDG